MLRAHEGRADPIAKINKTTVNMQMNTGWRIWFEPVASGRSNTMGTADDVLTMSGKTIPGTFQG